MASPDGDEYECLSTIGRGSFGVIKKVRRKADGAILCRKEINYGRMSQRYYRLRLSPTRHERGPG